MSLDNPYLKPEDYFQEYNKKIDELKSRPDVVELDKLCYMVFRTEEGKSLLNEFTNRYLIPGFVNPSAQNPGGLALFYEGFKEAFRLIRGSVLAHQQRIDAEKKPT